MKKDIRKQYDKFAESFSVKQEKLSSYSKEYFYKFIGHIRKKTKVLDLCCGDGSDMNFLKKKYDVNIIGVDGSLEIINIAKDKYPENIFDIALAEKLPYKKNTFDMVLSKYAIQTSKNINSILNEVHRILKPGGTFVFLTVHPLRHFFERRDLSANYFEQTEVESHLFNETLTVIEPTHTFNEYFNKDFFENFEMIDFVEEFDPAAENIFGGRYPSFFIVKARRR